MKDTGWIDKEIIACMRQDIHHAKLLLSLLQEEKTALDSRKLEALDQISDKKVAIYQLLEQSYQQRIQALQAHGYLGNKSGFQDLINQSDRYKKTLCDLNNQLAQLLTDIQTNNAINGTIIGISYNQLTRVLDVMCNRNTSELYGEQAETYQTNTSHTITKA